MDADGHELPRGEIGEIWIRSASVIKGYWNNPKATAESFTGGFWHSGDLGSIDAENFVRVFDRQKDMINRGGLKIYSAEVELVLAGHPDVVESAIIAKPCPVLGERVHAVIVTRGSGVGTEALRAWCAERLSDYKVPETMELTAEPLPRNANGKVMKRQLREAFVATGVAGIVAAVARKRGRWRNPGSVRAAARMRPYPDAYAPTSRSSRADKKRYSFGALPFGDGVALVLFRGKRLAVDRGRADRRA